MLRVFLGLCWGWVELLAPTGTSLDSLEQKGLPSKTPHNSQDVSYAMQQNFWDGQGKSMKGGHEDQGFLSQLGRSPYLCSSRPGFSGLSSGSSEASLEIHQNTVA